MKLFWGSIVFISVACFAPLAFGQSITSWQSNNGSVYGSLNPSGNFNSTANWSNGVPNGNLIGDIQVFNVTNVGTLNYYNNNNTITVTVPTGQSAAGMIFEQFFTTPQGVINFNFDPGAVFTLGGSGLSGSNPSMVLRDGIITNINGGTINVQSGLWSLGDPNLIFLNGDFNTLNLTGVNVNFGSNNIFELAPNTSQTGLVNQSTSTINAGSGFNLLLGSPAPGVFFPAGSATYNMTNGSLISAGANSVISIGNGTLNQDSTSTITLGSGSVINIGVLSGDKAIYNLAGNLNLNNTNINVGLGGSQGTFIQTGGNITGTGALTIGNGSYSLFAGNATFSQGLTVGTGQLNQYGGALVTGGSTASIGTGGYNLSGGSVDFQAGVTVAAGSTLNQTGGTLSAEGATTINGAYNLGNGTASFLTPASSVTVNGILVLNNGGTLSAPEDLLVGGAGATTGSNVILNGGTLRLLSGVTGAATTAYTFNGGLGSGGVSTVDTSASNLASVTFANALTSAGGIALNGNGGTVFNFASVGGGANNSYTGSTSISNGQLNAAQNDIASSSSLNIGSGGVLNLALNAAGFASTAPLSGPGTLNVGFNPAGTTATNVLVLPNASGFSGAINLGLTATPGTLQIYNGTFSGISDNGNGSSVVIGSPSKVGAIGVPSSGTVFLPGSNSYTGSTTITPGFTVLANNFSGSVVNAGTLSTFGTILSPSQMSIGGPLTSTGLITVYTNGTTADTYAVHGATASTLSGVVSTVGSGTNKYAVVTTNAGLLKIGGDGLLNDPNGLNTNAPLTLFSSTLSIDPTNSILYVNTVQKPLGTFAVTPAQKAVAGSLDPLTQTPPLAFAPLLTIFNNLPASEIAPSLTELSPENLQFSRNIAFENSTFMVQRLNGALSNLRTGYTGIDSSGISYAAPGFDSGLSRSMGSLLASNAPSFHTTAPNGVNYYPDDGSTPSGPTLPASDYEQPTHPSRMTPSQAASPTSYDGQVLSDSPIPMRTSQPPTLRSSRFSEFVAGDVVLSDINANANQDIASKASYTAGDIMAGATFRMTSNLSVGVLFDFNHTHAKTDANGSTMDVNGYTPGVFATFYEHNFYVNGLFAYGFNTYSNSRSINIGPLNGDANSSPNGQQYTLNIDTGYDFHPSQQWVVGPTLGLTYTHLNIDSASETGVPLANLNIASQSAESLRSRLGGHVEYIVRAGNIVLQPNVTAMWQHEYLDNGSGIVSSFQSFPTASSFTTPVASPTTDSALLGCGLTATLDNSMAFYLNYMADVGGGDYLTQSIVGGVKASF